MSQNFMSIAYLVLKLLQNGMGGWHHPLPPSYPRIQYVLFSPCFTNVDWIGDKDYQVSK